MIRVSKSAIVLFGFLLFACFLSACQAPVDAGGSPIEENALAAGVQQPTQADSDETDHAQTDPYAALRTALKTVTQEESEDLMTLFFRYYLSTSHLRELSMLPDFDARHAPDWDALTLYVYLNADQANFIEGNSLTRETFAQVLQTYMQEFAYTDRSSQYLTYESGVYAPVPGDTMWSGYYRLTEIAVDAENTYTASFDMLTFAETEYSNDYDQLQPNMKAIRDTAGVTGYEDMGKGVLANTVLSIYTQDDYHKILAMSCNTKIRFQLSGDEDFPILYLSCKTTASATSMSAFCAARMARSFYPTSCTVSAGSPAI